MKKIMLFILFIIFALFIVGCQGGEQAQTSSTGRAVDQGADIQQPAAQSEPAVVVSVNGEEIYDVQVYQMIEQMRMQNQPADEETIIRNLIQMELLVQEADNRNITFTDAEAEDEIRGLLGEHMSLDDLKTQLGPQYSTILEEQKQQMKVIELAHQEADINVTEEEAQAFFEENREMINPDVSYEEVSEEIKLFIQQQKLNNVLMAFVNELEEKADIQYY